MNDAFSETQELVRRGREGDREALDDLFSRHRERLGRMVRLRLDWRLKGRVAPDDVIQEVYLEALRRLPEYLEEPKVPFFVWLRFLTGQKLVDLQRLHLGAQARDARREVRLLGRAMPAATSADLAGQLLGTQTTPSEVVQRAELKLKLKEALDQMDATDREVLILRHYENLTHEEVAHELSIARPAAIQRYVRALKKIQKILASMPEGLVDTWMGQKNAATKKPGN